MKRHLLLLAALLLAIASTTVFAQSSTRTSKRDAGIVRAVRAVLDAQSAAWNRGDITGYMDGYARSPKTVFVSGDSVTRGWQTVLERYQKRYDSREKMGTLTYSDLEISTVGNDNAIVLGSWRLHRTSNEPHGRFTLIFKRTKQGWKIVHDHTSSAD